MIYRVIYWFQAFAFKINLYRYDEAEDLGVITEDVVELREAIEAPGMVVLQFAWGGGGRSPHLPHNHYENSFCYPGTHDNETSQGWYDAQDDATKLRMATYANITEAGVALFAYFCSQNTVQFMTASV